MADPDLPIPASQADDEVLLTDPDAPIPEILAADIVTLPDPLPPPPAAAPSDIPLQARAFGSNPIYRGKEKQ